MGKAKKSTKLFKRKHLAQALENRAQGKVFKAKIAARKHGKKARHPGPAEAGAESHMLQPSKPLEEMGVDEFMVDGFRGLLEDDASGSESDMSGGDDDPADDADDLDTDGVGDEFADGSSEHDNETLGDSADEELTSLQQATETLGDELVQHKQQLAKLKAQQPEFYEFLLQNDKSLLDFAASDDDEASDAEEGGDTEEAAQDNGAAVAAHDRSASAKKRTVTKEMVQDWRIGLKKDNVAALKRALPAFTEACHEHDEESTVQTKFRISSAAIFNAVIRLCVEHAVRVLDHGLGLSSEIEARGLPSSQKKWKSLRGAVKVYLGNLLMLLPSLADVDMLTFILAHTASACRYFACFPKLAKRLFKVCLELWSTAGSEDARMHAFLVLRTLAIVQPQPYLEIALKGTYLTFVRNCKFRSMASAPLLRLMENCVVELYRLDRQASYQHAFVYIRQLAIHLRSAITTKKKESFAQVYNWQFLGSLKLWARVLAECGGTGGPEEKHSLQPLIYPLVQITVAVIRLIPTARYFPLRFQCIQVLLELAEQTATFIPLGSLILHPLDSHEMKKKPRPSTDKAMVLRDLLKVSKTKLDSKQFQDATFQSVFECTLKFFAQHAYSIGFPEIVVTALAKLKPFAKSTKNPHFQKQIKLLIQKLQENSDFIQQRRSNVDFSPKNVIEIDKWSRRLRTEKKSPLAKYAHLWLAAEARRLESITGDEPPSEAVAVAEDTAAAAGTGKRKRMAEPSVESETEEPAGDVVRKGKKSKTTKVVAAPADSESDESYTGALGQDDVGDFHMSDFEDDGDF